MRNQSWLWALVVVIIVAGLAYFFWPKGAAMAPATQSNSTVPAPRADTAYVGSWKSIDDAKFTRSFSADGTINDTYEGDASASMTGTWSVVADPSSIPNLPSMGGDPILKVVFDMKSPMYFAVLSMSSTTLSMTYLEGNGQPQNFKKVQ